jgi:hypothetical protein
MAELPGFVRKQYEFAAHIRDPENRARPADVDERRMAIYRELFFNNIEDFLGSSFPIARAILGPDRWPQMVRDFYAHHRSNTPLFPKMPEEFLHYLRDARSSLHSDPPFLQELAHYEWMELVAAQSDAELEADGVDPGGDLLGGIPVVSPLAWVLSYEYPVHRIGPAFRPDAPGDNPTCLVVHRDRDDEVRFVEISPVTAHLLRLLDSGEALSGRAALERIAEELGQTDPGSVIDYGSTMLSQLREQGIVIGTRMTG